MGGIVEIPAGQARLHPAHEHGHAGWKRLLLGTALDQTC
jgi:hypothetical protein